MNDEIAKRLSEGEELARRETIQPGSTNMQTVAKTLEKTAKHLSEAIVHNSNDLINRTKDPASSLQFVCNCLLVSVANIVSTMHGLEQEAAQDIHGRLLNTLQEFSSGHAAAPVKPEYEQVQVVQKPTLYIPGQD